MFLSDDAFAAYATHQQTLDNIVNNLLFLARKENYRACGSLDFTINCSEDLSSNDLDYIKKELERKL